nr:reverse transcriptase domain-containing protein [Tanacetum cinerariifolium]
MKKVIVELPFLTTPIKEETLYVYVAAATEAVSTVLLAERKRKQCPIRYMNMTLNEAEKNCAPLEKLAMSLLHMSRRLRSTNNEAEYEALLVGLRVAKKMKVQNIDVKVDSKLVASQINGSYMESSASMIKYLATAKECIAELTTFANYVIREIHMRFCGIHIGARSVVEKAIRKGYYWPTMHRDARNVMQKRDSYQVHALVPRRPKTLMTSIMVPWPFYQWGMDILGPLPQAARKSKFVIVTIDYFTKWIEAKLLARITRKDVKKFMWDNIVCKWAVERANKSLMEGIKARLGSERAGWVDELPNVLWAHRTSLKQSNGETPVSLTYGSKAVITADIGMPTRRTMMIREDENEDELRLNMDLLQERREVAIIREAKYKTKMEQYYNQKVRPMSFKPDEYVFQRNEASRVEDQGKLGPKWEGPYRVTEAYHNGSYKLQTMRGKDVPRTWHAINLRKCYIQVAQKKVKIAFENADSSSRVELIPSKIKPSGFTKPNVQNNQNRFSQPQGYNRGKNFNQDTSYQAPIQQNQVVPLSELEKIKKINKVNIKTMQDQINNVKNELRNEMQTLIQASMSKQTIELKNMMASFFQMNIASTSGSGPLPSNTIANPKGKLKAITIRSGLVLDGPSVPIPPPFINQEENKRAEETLTDPEIAEYTIKVPPFLF